jgi:hypothetical protein
LKLRDDPTNLSVGRKGLFLTPPSVSMSLRRMFSIGSPSRPPRDLERAIASTRIAAEDRWSAATVVVRALGGRRAPRARSAVHRRAACVDTASNGGIRVFWSMIAPPSRPRPVRVGYQRRGARLQTQRHPGAGLTPARALRCYHHLAAPSSGPLLAPSIGPHRARWGVRPIHSRQTMWPELALGLRRRSPLKRAAR